MLAPRDPSTPSSHRLVLFAHGAGLASSHAWMTGWAARLSSLGRVVTFDYPYMAAGKKRPDAHDTLVDAHRAALADARRAHRGPVVLAGKSMGSRIGCHVALLEKVAALVCLGYPLVSQSGKLRDEVLLALRTPILFVQGTRDSLCPLDELAKVRARMSAPNELFVVEGGDHSLALSVAARRTRSVTQAESDDDVLRAITTFVTRHAR